MPSSEAMGGHTLRSQGPWPGLGTLRSSSGKESLLLALATGFWPKLIESGTEVGGAMQQAQNVASGPQGGSGWACALSL